MTWTREQAREYARENIARICAEQGLTVQITDPALLSFGANVLRAGKDNYDAARVECLAR